MAQESEAAVRRAEGEALRAEPAGRPSFLSSSILVQSPSESTQDPSISVSDSVAIPDASAEARTSDSFVYLTEDAASVEMPTGSLDIEPHDLSSVRSMRSMPWDRASILASLELRRHDRAVAAAMSVAGPEVSTDLDWSPTVGFGLAQSTHNGSTWTWSLPGRRETVVHLWNGAGETVLAVADQAVAGRVVEAYLRSLSGDGPRLRIDVSYAGRYDLSLPHEANVALFDPVTDVLRRPSLVPGAPDVEDEEEPPFSTDEAWFDDEDLPLAA